MVKGPFLIFSSARLLQPLFAMFEAEKSRRNLAKAGLTVSPSFYLSLCFLNSLLYAVLISLVIFGANIILPAFLPIHILFMAIGVFIGFLVFFLFYPSILTHRKTALLEKDLFFAIKDLSIQISSGITLYDAMSNVAKGNYGEVSAAFKSIVYRLDSGSSLDASLEEALNSTDSEQFKQMLWQILGALRSGSNLSLSLESIVNSLKRHQQDAIVSYLHEVNLWVLIYLIVAVTIPSIIAALISVLLTVAGGYADISLFILIYLGALMAQLLLLAYIRIRRPVVSM